MRRWKKGAGGALSMGMYHGLYCLGCCWPYFLIMVALGWMDILWMALFAGIILVEKIWSRGIWAARVAGAALILTGMAVTVGLVDVQGNQMTLMTDSMPMENNAEEQMLDDQSPGTENSMDSKGPTEDPMTDKGMSGSGM
jgi:predicted metal-binding membrane protein